MSLELPAIASSQYVSSTINLSGVEVGIDSALSDSRIRRVQTVSGLSLNTQAAAPTFPTIEYQKGIPIMSRRLVRVIIADPNPNIPLEKAVLYNGAEQFTDLTDQELFYEVSIKELLDKHNEMRTKLLDKDVKDRTQNLEPARIRDLRMTVVTVASF